MSNLLEKFHSNADLRRRLCKFQQETFENIMKIKEIINYKNNKLNF